MKTFSSSKCKDLWCSQHLTLCFILAQCGRVSRQRLCIVTLHAKENDDKKCIILTYQNVFLKVLLKINVLWIGPKLLNTGTKISNIILRKKSRLRHKVINIEKCENDMNCHNYKKIYLLH